MSLLTPTGRHNETKLTEYRHAIRHLNFAPCQVWAGHDSKRIRYRRASGDWKSEAKMIHLAPVERTHGLYPALEINLIAFDFLTFGIPGHILNTHFRKRDVRQSA